MQNIVIMIMFEQLNYIYLAYDVFRMQQIQTKSEFNF